MEFDHGVDHFLNTGLISGPTDGVVIVGVTGDFLNSGTITDNGGGADGVEFKTAAVGTFRNASGGSITGSAEGVLFKNGVTTFVNEAGASIHGDDAGVYFYPGVIGSFSNAGDISAGDISGHGVQFNSGTTVTSFRNEATGRIWAGGDDGTVNFRGSVTSFFNAGQIWNANNGDGVRFQHSVTSFANSGTIYSESNGGVDFQDTVDIVFNSGKVGAGALGYGYGFSGDVGSFVNTGTVSGDYGVAFGGDVGSFANTGTIEAGYYAVSVSASTVGSFENGATGRISSPETGIFLTLDSMGTLTNAGYIEGTNHAALDLSAGGAINIVNSGTIVGYNGILLDATVAGHGAVTNSGIIRGIGGVAIDFGYVCGCGHSALARNETLTILTGSKIFGTMNFGTGTDTLDFSGFAGNTVLDVPGLDIVVPGSRGYVWDKPNTKIAIFDLSGFDNQGIGADWNAIAQAMFETEPDADGGWSGLNPDSGGVRDQLCGAAGRDSGATGDRDGGDERARHDPASWPARLGQRHRRWQRRRGGDRPDLALWRHRRRHACAAEPDADTGWHGGRGAIVELDAQWRRSAQQLDRRLGLYGSAQFGVADIDFSLIARPVAQPVQPQGGGQRHDRNGGRAPSPAASSRRRSWSACLCSRRMAARSISRLRPAIAAASSRATPRPVHR